MAKAKNGDLPFASTGVGSTTHLAIEMFATAAGFKFVHVPYRGAAPALTDLLGGQVQALLRRRAGADAADHRRQGQAARAPPPTSAIRCCPTCRRSPKPAIPNTSSDNWYGLLAPAKTPPAIVAKLNAAFVAAINDPVVKDKLIKSGAIPVAEHAGAVRPVPQGRARALGQAGAREGHQGAGLTAAASALAVGR